MYFLKFLFNFNQNLIAFTSRCSFLCLVRFVFLVLPSHLGLEIKKREHSLQKANKKSSLRKYLKKIAVIHNPQHC